MHPLDVRLGSREGAAAPLDDGPPEFVALQPVGIVDHLCAVDEAMLKGVLQGEVGGSSRVTQQEVTRLLSMVGEFHSKAGGSAANTMRGLAAGFGVRCGIVGARGMDENGAFFQSSLKRAHVHTERLRVLKGDSTGRSVILSCNGQRTMRTCLEGAAALTADDLSADDFAGAAWAFFSAYGLYQRGLLLRAISLAKQAGAKIALDLASFEVVRAFREPLLELLAAHRPDFLICNEDEALEVQGGPAPGRTPEEALESLAGHADIAVVTLGERGCILRRSGSPEIITEPAASGVQVTDATGAGDLFAAGFLYGLMRGYPLQRCARIGCLAGGAVVQSVGAELSPANWRWLFARLHGELAAGVVRDSASAVSRELLACYALVERLGRGVVYYGSARLRKGSPHWGRARELGRRVAGLLGCTTWSGGGPGMMEAATLGAMDAGAPVGGIRISREAGTTVRTASYLPDEAAVFCRFLSSRKVALVDCGVRASEQDRGAYIFLPGGLGTMDELFEILTLVQLKKLGSKLPVPMILVNYDGFYGSLMEFLRACDRNGTIGAPELRDVVIAAENDEVLGCLAGFYGLPWDQPLQLHSASSWIANGAMDIAAPDAAGGTSVAAAAAAASAEPAVPAAAAASAAPDVVRGDRTADTAAQLHQETSTGLAPVAGTEAAS